uniref:RanBD1 domain-containing protein n=1 Tax=Pseudo-nitzschia australis TaxID=44445 RepID=A0A7S4AKT3_9STRA|mmetsp:Transcript_22430/g.45476  ORF Transcript_22430/g.45476 Transcript_22430/m.45476 type:complete len:441 (+) Transcript_22430:175-1497(+)
MGKRGNENAQVSKEDYEASMTSASDVPKGPFAKASADVIKGRRILKTRRSGISKKPTPSTTSGNSIFSSVSLAAPGGSPAAASGGGSNPFGGFSFGSGKTPTTVPAASKKTAYPSFAMPAAVPTKSPTIKATTTAVTSKTSEVLTDEDKERIKCARGFLKHMNKFSAYDEVAGRRFAATFAAFDKPKASATATTAAKQPTKTTNWDTSKPLFGGKSPVSAAASPPATALFGATPSPAATGGFSFKTTTDSAASPAASGGFSFNPTKIGTAAAPVPAFSFSTTPTPAVKAAAEAAVAETSAKADTSTVEDESKENGPDGVQEAANNPYEVLFKTTAKVFRVRTGKYVARGGALKLEQHKDTKKNQLVVRDKAVGRVQLNVAITKGMPISKAIAPGVKNKPPTPIVLITSVFDAESGKPELFKIITKMEDHENLFDELSKLV